MDFERAPLESTPATASLLEGGATQTSVWAVASAPCAQTTTNPCASREQPTFTSQHCPLDKEVHHGN